jgi:hypothetical protein
MKLILEATVLYTKEAKPYKDKDTGEMKQPEHKCLVVVEDNIIEEDGNIKPSTQELKSFLLKEEILKGKQKFEVKASPWIPEGKNRAELSIKILKAIK